MLTTSLVSVRAVAARPALADHVGLARDRLARHVLDQLSADGSVEGVCEARVLESALALCLFDRVGTQPQARERVAAFLEREALAGPQDPFHHVLTASALGWPARIGTREGVDAYLRGFDHFTSARKRVFFGIVLEIVTGEDLELGLRPEHFVAGPETQRWVAVMMYALEVLYFCQHGRPELVPAEHVRALLETTAPTPNGTWEQYMLGHLLTLLALEQLPAHEGVVRRCVEALVGLQRPSGGFGFITRMEVFATATAGLALVGAGVRREPLLRTGDFLADLQRPDGGWGYAVGVQQTDVDDTAYCVELLRALDPVRYRDPIAAAERYIVALQNPDGGFPTFARGCDSEVAMTAAALNALAPSRREHREVLRRGVEYILDHQHLDGTFERSWSCANANAMFRALLAIQTSVGADSMGARTEAECRALAYMRAAQNGDGGWGHVIGDESDPVSTAYTLIGLSHFDARPMLARGVDYLLEQQQADGGFVSRPDNAGPRPIAYDVPVLADHFVLLALDHVVATHPAAREQLWAVPGAVLPDDVGHAHPRAA